MLTQKELKENLKYNPETGSFTRIKKIYGGKLGECACSLDSNGYVMIYICGHLHRGHRLAWLYQFGESPEQVDHINRINDDNRIKNLRSCGNSENNMNKPKQKNNKSGFKGVHWSKSRRLWIAQVTSGGKTLTLGSFWDKETASQVAKIKRNELHGEFANHG